MANSDSEPSEPSLNFGILIRAGLAFSNVLWNAGVENVSLRKIRR